MTVATFTYSPIGDLSDGTYLFTLTLGEVTDGDGKGMSAEGTSTTGNYVIATDPDASAFEVYYELDRATDAHTPNYIDYEIGDTVTATVYIKSTAGAAELQAYDLHVTNDALLTRGTVTSSSDATLNTGSGTTATDLHLQGIFEEGRYLSLTKDTPAVLARIPYTIGTGAVYETGMPITITAGSAKVAIAGTAKPFVPIVTGTTLGAEVVTEKTVTFDANGGAGTMSPQPVGYNKATTLAANTPTRDGYAFAGWNTAANGSGTAYADGANITTKEDVTLYAQWTANSYEVKFNANDGTGAMGNQTFTYGVAQNLTANAFTRTGYTFAGWNTAADGSGAAYADQASVSNLAKTGVFDLYAQWTPITYTVTYDLSGGTGTKPTNTTATYDQSFTAPAQGDLAKDGYTFAGWSTNSGAATADYAGGAAVNENLSSTQGATVTLYAVWTKDSYTITYNGTDGATFSATNPTNYSVDTADFTLVNPTKAGYTFTGWTGSNGDDPETTVTVTQGTTGNLTYTANWTATQYTITYVDNGSAAHPVINNSPASYTIEAAVTLADPTRTGYTFGGWYDNEDLIGTAVTSIPAGSTDEKTFYAKWTATTYTITFYQEDSMTVVDTQTFTVESASITEPAVPAKTGYTGAWGSYSTDTLDNQSVIPTYTAIEYTIHFVTDGGTAIVDQTYTIESTGTLPTTTKTGYAFQGWTVAATTDGDPIGWEATAEESASLAGKYGNVTLTAQWKLAVTARLFDYWYAPSGYQLLVVSGDSANYSYGGAEMYYTTEEAYKNLIDGAEGVYLYLVEESSYAESSIAISANTRATLERSGDVNGDGAVDIADANAVYRMIQNTNHANYYTLTQVNILGRLVADMNADYVSTVGGALGASIADVQAILDKING
ncbi:MAG: InlB B-repeat-containing protein [Oscillibacter sp.]|nr:InlB B-repeat-containing protein [Oscillibacter sp.]